MDRPNPQLGTHTETTGERILAWFADAVIILVVTIIIWRPLGGFSTFIWLGVLVSFAYRTVFEAMYGQTLGKKAVGIVVVKENGGPCDWRAAAIRNIIRVVDSFLFYLVGLVFIVLTKENQRLGDLVADTVVPEVAPVEMDFLIEVHHDEGTGNRYMILVNGTEKEVDLSRGALRTNAGSEFRFPQEEATISPGERKGYLIPDHLLLEPDGRLTLLTRGQEQFRADLQER